MSITLKALIEAYQTDPVSTYHKLRFHVRQNHEALLGRLSKQYGHVLLSDIRARDLKLWHMGWTDDGKKLSMGKAFLGQISTMSAFGLTMLEETECERISLVLSKLKFEKPEPKKGNLTADHATAIRAKAHEFGLGSIALAQAIQFELTLRQKDVIGEWVPVNEPGLSDVTHDGKKWFRGIRWDAVNANLILTHVTSKKQKPLKADLNLAPMVIKELALMGGRQTSGPIIICETTGVPWSAAEYRRKWRMIATAAGVPDEVKSMHSRHGGTSEAFEANANPDHIRQSLTHSDIKQTQAYNVSDMDLENRSGVMKARVAKRNKTET